jgi:hypothetical protein
MDWWTLTFCTYAEPAAGATVRGAGNQDACVHTYRQKQHSNSEHCNDPHQHAESTLMKHPFVSEVSESVGRLCLSALRYKHFIFVVLTISP